MVTHSLTAEMEERLRKLSTAMSNAFSWRALADKAQRQTHMNFIEDPLHCKIWFCTDPHIGLSSHSTPLLRLTRDTLWPLFWLKTAAAVKMRNCFVIVVVVG